ncbi:hypothetical protein [Staphylococcus equorum]|uniref:hypothetical protein n=1 Tax=Staphylococcus equorum TaxID=246432 RepID=UPI003FD87694
MSSKKTKIIEFDEGTIALVNKYGEAKGINTFSGAIREMVESELGKYGMREISKGNKTSGGALKGGTGERTDLESQLSSAEAELFQEIIDIIRMYNGVEIEFSKLFDDINKKKKKRNESFGKTVFEKLTSHPVESYDEYIEHIYTLVRGLFKGGSSYVLRIDELLRELSQNNHNNIKIKNIDVYSLESVEKAEVNEIKNLIYLYRVKRKVQNNEYNDLLLKYYEYKEGYVSKHSIMKTLSEYVYEPNPKNKIIE